MLNCTINSRYLSIAVGKYFYDFYNARWELVNKCKLGYNMSRN
jgi:hypothetical protein